MFLSQFTVYTSADVGAPQLTGTTGSLLAVLNACLVTGYGSKSPAGWLKPFADTYAFPGVNTLGGFVMPSGSKCGFFVNDSGRSSAAGSEASITGWEQLLNPMGIAVDMTASAGGGIGQFPTPAQSLTTGRVVWRKSSTTDLFPRHWKIFADAYTIYVFIETGDSNGTYYGGFFGDFYALSPADTYRCHLHGRIVDANSAMSLGNSPYDLLDSLSGGNYGGSVVGPWSYQAAEPMHYVPRSYTYQNYGPGSQKINKSGDFGKTSGYNSATWVPMAGVIPFPNGPDKAIYVSPLWLWDSNYNNSQIGPNMRGKYRGMYHVCHPVTSFGDGQIYQGAGVHANRTFMIVKQGGNSGFWAMEISPTIETN